MATEVKGAKALVEYEWMGDGDPRVWAVETLTRAINEGKIDGFYILEVMHGSYGLYLIVATVLIGWERAVIDRDTTHRDAVVMIEQHLGGKVFNDSVNVPWVSSWEVHTDHLTLVN